MKLKIVSSLNIFTNMNTKISLCENISNTRYTLWYRYLTTMVIQHNVTFGIFWLFKVTLTEIYKKMGGTPHWCDNQETCELCKLH